MKAVVEKYDEDKGVWKFAGVVRDIKAGEAWIAKYRFEKTHRVRDKHERAMDVERT